jgi:hypothetical protein
MYHPVAMDQIRVQQEQLRRQAEWTWTFEEAARRRYPPKERRQWWPRPVGGRLRLAFAGVRRSQPCPDC